MADMISDCRECCALTSRMRLLVAMRQTVTFFKSIFAAAIHLVGKVFRGNFLIFASKLPDFISDESIVATVIGHFETVRAMNPTLTKRHKNYVLRYFGHYLANSFNKKTIRREILKFHHQYLREHVVESFYEQLLESESLLWNEIIDENKYTISLAQNLRHVEGDLRLVFRQNGNLMYKIYFTIVPGRLINHAVNQVLLVGLIQGAREQSEAIRTATRACRDIAPPYLLIAAAESIAGALAIDAIAGISNEELLSKPAESCFFDYNKFWETFAVKKKGAGFYEIPVPIPQKPLEQINVGHRRRTRRKRQFKSRVAASVRETFAEKFLKMTLQTSTDPPARRDKFDSNNMPQAGAAASTPPARTMQP